MNPVAIHLYGPLADKYGPLHHFAVATPREAVQALDANFPGFIGDFAKHQIYHVHADGDWREGDEAALLPVAREIHLVPQIEGRAALVGLVIGAIIPALATTTILGVSAAALIGGVLFSAALIGLSFLFQPKTPDEPEQTDQEENEGFAFTGPENVVMQGAAIPLAYGKVHCGSVVVAAGLEVAELSDWSTDPDDPWSSELRSKQYAKIVDVVSDGIITSLTPSDIFLDGVALPQLANTSVQIAGGYRSQPIMTGFESQATEMSVGLELEWGAPLLREIINTDVDRVRITLSTPALQEVADDGTTWGATVGFKIEVAQSSGPYNKYVDARFVGHTTTRYQRAYLITLPKPGPWTIGVMRSSPKSTSVQMQHDLFWDSYTELIDDRVNYNGTAACALFLDSEQFSTIPKRTYLVTGIAMLVPTNYNPWTGTYSGLWDGTFKFEWTNNPAWVLYDLLTSYRHGIGYFLNPNQVDKWSFYKVAQWCDAGVPDGHGGLERRFTCNVHITDRQESFDLIAQIAGIFRGFIYWNGTQMVAVADQPSDPVQQFTNANVVDGSFSYSGSDLRARHSMATVTWNDPKLLGQPRQAVVEDPEAISRYGIQETEIEAVGCTSEGQAIRTGKWALYTELYEGESIRFSAGLESAYARPGDIIAVADVNVAGARFGGRVVSADPPSGGVVLIRLDNPVPVGAGGVSSAYYITCMMSDGHVETRQIAQPPVEMALSQVAAYGMSEAPAPDTVFVVSTAALNPTLWRVITVSQQQPDSYEIQAVRHFPGKWAYVENNLALSQPAVSIIPLAPPAPINISITEYLVQLSPISVGVRVVLSWYSQAPYFYVNLAPQNGNWQTLQTDALTIDMPVTEGPWTFRITPVSAIGIKGPAGVLNYTVIGRFAPPAAPQQFRVKISDGVALFEWLPATELDVVIGGHFELRHSSATSGANWASAQTVIPSIPGSATTVEAVYRTGTWLLRTFDIVGVASVDVAAIIALQPDGRYNEFARVCENPDWLGDHNYTEVLEPQDWLVIGQTGGLWDAQTADMDDWPDVDVLVEGLPSPPQSAARHGWYLFEDRIDAGGVFTVRFSADILAFPYADPDEFIDSRLIDCDDWNDWDDVDDDLGGQVVLYIRSTNQDPASPTAIWSAWQVFSPVEYTGRGFEFRADLFAPAGQNIGVETLCIIADLRMKMDSAEDVPYPAATTHVAFTVKFYLVPSVVVTVQNATNTDDIQVINKTREGFDLTVKNPSGVHQTRTFDWQARGF